MGYAVLRALELRRRGPSLISCPTCGRRKIDVFQVVQDLEPLLKDLPEDLEIAVMGCEVNGPREAAQADLGVAGTPSGAVFFAQGIQKGRMEGQSPREIARALRKMAGEMGMQKKTNETFYVPRGDLFFRRHFDESISQATERRMVYGKTDPEHES